MALLLTPSLSYKIVSYCGRGDKKKNQCMKGSCCDSVYHLDFPWFACCFCGQALLWECAGLQKAHKQGGLTGRPQVLGTEHICVCSHDLQERRENINECKTNDLSLRDVVVATRVLSDMPFINAVEACLSEKHEKIKNHDTRAARLQMIVFGCVDVLYFCLVNTEPCSTHSFIYFTYLDSYKAITQKVQ